jgi:Protein of unknown function (DUF2867)
VIWGGMTRARSILPPRESALAPLYKGADLVDAYAVALPPGAPEDVGVLARAVLGGLSRWWVRSLMATRDAAVALVGVKTSRQIAAAAAGRGPVIGFFPVLSQTEHERIMGEDDRHLDFRGAILVQGTADGGRTLALVSVVHCHNALGRMYLRAIGPFHRAIVQTSLERAVVGMG